MHLLVLYGSVRLDGQQGFRLVRSKTDLYVMSPAAAPFTKSLLSCPSPCVPLYHTYSTDHLSRAWDYRYRASYPFAVERTLTRFPPTPSVSSLAAVFHDGATGAERIVAVGLCSLPPRPLLCVETLFQHTDKVTTRGVCHRGQVPHLSIILGGWQCSEKDGLN